MILSEKITELRKMNGLSQEALGEKIGVSRQAVSKWEMAQTVPDLNKIIAMAEVFGVSTDALLRDDLEIVTKSIEVNSDTTASTVRVVKTEEIDDYFSAHNKLAKRIALCIFIFSLAATPGIVLSAIGETYGILGAIIEILALVIISFIAVPTLLQMPKYSYLKKDGIELEYGIKGKTEELKKAFTPTLYIGIVSGIAVCISSVIPMMVCSFFEINCDLHIALGGCLMLLFISAGITSIVFVLIKWQGFRRVLSIN